MKEKRNEEPDILRNSVVNSFEKQVIHPPYLYVYTYMCTCTYTSKCRFCNIRLVKSESVPVFKGVDIGI